jgi:hypothetical protein
MIQDTSRNGQIQSLQVCYALFIACVGPEMQLSDLLTLIELNNGYLCPVLQ